MVFKKNPFSYKPQVSYKNYDKSKGIYDDYATRKNIDTYQGTIQATPTAAKDIVNKEYVDNQFPVTHASTTGQTTDDHHAESHTIASHSDTSATGAELNTLTDNSMADTLHRHSELSASDGSPDAALTLDANGSVTLAHTATPAFEVKDTTTNSRGNIFMYDNIMGIGTITNHSLRFDIQGAEKMRLDTSGNLGINVTPSQKLDVNGVTLVRDKLAFTQADLNEYIDSETDGDLDYNATTSHDFSIGGTEQITLTDGAITPTTDNDIDLGDSTHEFKDVYVEAAYSAGIRVGGTATGGYVNRGDPAAADFDVGDLTTNGTAQDLDLSSIVPAGAKAVYIRLVLMDDAAGSYIQFRKNGNSNWQSAPSIRTQVSGVTMDGQLIVPCDSSRVVEYRATNTTFTTINIIVSGWFI